MVPFAITAWIFSSPRDSAAGGGTGDRPGARGAVCVKEKGGDAGSTRQPDGTVRLAVPEAPRAFALISTSMGRGSFFGKIRDCSDAASETGGTTLKGRVNSPRTRST